VTRRRTEAERVRHPYWRAGDPEKWCSRCHEVKPVAAFYARGETGTPFSMCRECQLESSAARDRANPAARNARSALHQWRKRQRAY
jgi:hypothetical protein